MKHKQVMMFCGVQLAPSFGDVISRLTQVNVTSLRDAQRVNDTANRCAMTSSYLVLQRLIVIEFHNFHTFGNGNKSLQKKIKNS